MFAISTLVLVAAFAIVTVGLPFRFAGSVDRFVSRAQSALLATTREAVFEVGLATAEQRLLVARIWGGATAFVFVVLGVAHGGLIYNDPTSVGTVVVFQVLAAATSGLLILSLLAFFKLLPRARAYATLNCFGVKALWVLDGRRPPEPLTRTIENNIRSTTSVSILGVTGEEMLGDGKGSIGGILQEALRWAPSLPVKLLLLQPQTEAPDPDRQQATISQTVLAEMGTSPAAFVKKLRRTLSVVEELNADREADARIEVRWYSQKPALRAVIFDETALVSPWCSRENGRSLPCLEVTSAAEPSFFEGFRRQFATLWRSSRSVALPASGSGVAAASFRQGSTVVRRKQRSRA